MARLAALGVIKRFVIDFSTYGRKIFYDYSSLQVDIASFIHDVSPTPVVCVHANGEPFMANLNERLLTEQGFIFLGQLEDMQPEHANLARIHEDVEEQDHGEIYGPDGFDGWDGYPDDHPMWPPPGGL